MTDKERLRQTQAQQGLNHWPPQGPAASLPLLSQQRSLNNMTDGQLRDRPVATTHYALRLSDEDVQRIAIAVVARLELLRGDA